MRKTRLTNQETIERINEQLQALVEAHEVYENATHNILTSLSNYALFLEEQAKQLSSKGGA